MQIDESSSSPDESGQMALWDQTQPPPEAAAFLVMMERLRTRAWDDTEATIRRNSDGTSVRSILLRQAKAMETIRTSFGQYGPPVLLPDFTGSDLSHLESALVSLMPQTTEQLHEVEQAAAEIGADPESRELIADMAERMPAKVDMNRPTAWAVLILVGGVLMAAAPDIPPNDIMMLAIIVAVAIEVWKRYGTGGS